MIKKKFLCVAALSCAIVFALSSCALFKSEINSLKGSITGNTYSCEFYSNDGQKFMTTYGQNIDIGANIIREKSYSSNGGWGYVQSMSSVITITIDGSQIENCGSTVIFAEDGLEKDADFMAPEVIESHGGSPVIIANIVNDFKNAYGKGIVVVIQSQLGDPICAYSGNSVYWEVCEDLPKTTKLMIDDHALYIHRANFQIIDKSLLD